VRRCKASSFVKRKAGENPALSRSGDGNERSQWPEANALSLEEMGSGGPVGSPKSEGRPATTTMEAITRSPWVRLSLPLSWIGTVDNAISCAFRHYDAACAWVVLPEQGENRNGTRHPSTNIILRLSTHGQESRTQVRARVFGRAHSLRQIFSLLQRSFAVNIGSFKKPRGLTSFPPTTFHSTTRSSTLSSSSALHQNASAINPSRCFSTSQWRATATSKLPWR
jgi:hypothetical protein